MTVPSGSFGDSGDAVAFVGSVALDGFRLDRRVGERRVVVEYPPFEVGDLGTRRQAEFVDEASPERSEVTQCVRWLSRSITSERESCCEAFIER